MYFYMHLQVVQFAYVAVLDKYFYVLLHLLPNEVSFH